MTNRKDPTPHWRETDPTREPVKCVDGLYRHLTQRAWDERYEYAKARVEVLMAEAKEHYMEARALGKDEVRIKEVYKDIVMIRVSDGHREPLITPGDFSKKYGVPKGSITTFINDPTRLTSYGWLVAGRTPHLEPMSTE